METPVRPMVADAPEDRSFDDAEMESCVSVPTGTPGGDDDDDDGAVDVPPTPAGPPVEKEGSAHAWLR